MTEQEVKMSDEEKNSAKQIENDKPNSNMSQAETAALVADTINKRDGCWVGPNLLSGKVYDVANGFIIYQDCDDDEEEIYYVDDDELDESLYQETGEDEEKIDSEE